MSGKHTEYLNVSGCVIPGKVAQEGTVVTRSTSEPKFVYSCGRLSVHNINIETRNRLGLQRSVFSRSTNLLTPFFSQRLPLLPLPGARAAVGLIEMGEAAGDSPGGRAGHSGGQVEGQCSPEG